MDFANWQYRQSELPKDNTEKETLLEQLKETFLAEVQTNATVQAWLQNYSDSNQESFLKYYARYKADLIRYSDIYIRKTEQVLEIKHRSITQKTLAMLLQKKLFHLQCQWRAEQITLPGIRISWDFWYWSQHIFTCPYLDPITPAEVQVLQRFVQTEEYDPEVLYPTSFGWQYYDEIISKIQEEEEDEMVSWYTYYDTYMGTSSYLLLPNIRGQKEKVYYDIVRKKEEAERLAANIVPRPPIEMKQMLWYTPSWCYQMAQQFEDPYFLSLMQADSEETAEGDALEEQECDYDSYIVQMKNIPDLPPVRAGLSWRMALKYCYSDYLRNFVYQDLPACAEEYQMYRSMGLLYQINGTEEKQEKLEDFSMSNHQIQRILQARAMLGEPEDLDF